MAATDAHAREKRSRDILWKVVETVRDLALGALCWHIYISGHLSWMYTAPSFTHSAISNPYIVFSKSVVVSVEVQASWL